MQMILDCAKIAGASIYQAKFKIIYAQRELSLIKINSSFQTPFGSLNTLNLYRIILINILILWIK